MEITREKYLEALDIVETYHQHLQDQCKKLRYKDWEDLQIGDKVIFTKSMSKYIIIDKEYEIVDINRSSTVNWRDYFCVIGENGKEKHLPKHPQGYKYRILP